MAGKPPFIQGICRLVGLRISRKPVQKTMIYIPPSQVGTTVWIGIDKIQGETARLAFNAPQQVQIWREELLHNDLDEVSALPPDTRTNRRGDSSDSG